MVRANGEEWKICLEDVFEIAKKVGYPQDIQNNICDIVYENIVDNCDGKANEWDIRNHLVYYYAQAYDDVYYDMLRPYEKAMPGDVSPMNADWFVYEQMVDELMYYEYQDFDSAAKLEEIGNDILGTMMW